MRALGFDAKKDEVKRLMNQADANGSGVIEFDEFVKLMQSKM